MMTQLDNTCIHLPYKISKISGNLIVPAKIPHTNATAKLKANSLLHRNPQTPNLLQHSLSPRFTLNEMDYASPAPRKTSKTNSTQTQNPSPNPKGTINHIGGIAVAFPYKPYGSQLGFMGRVISTLDKAKNQGHSHALLESPTGTGKTLSLLCSVLAWQKNYASKNLYANFSHSKPNPEAVSDPLGHGGGFVPEPTPSSNSTAENFAPDPSANEYIVQKKKTPTIFYASRTHAQISQAIREYRKTSYRVRMAVLGSRKHYCTNRTVSGKENIDEECKLLMKSMPGDQGCMQFINVKKVIGHPSLGKGGCNEAHDIEDLVKVGLSVRGCSYFAARAMAQEAQLVFCPYSYILSPTIRRAMEVDLKGSIVILDEAHNIEDMAREAASVDIEEDVLYTLQRELEQLHFTDSSIYPPLQEMIEGITSWIRRRETTLVKREFQHYSSCWTGDKAKAELQEAGISQQIFSILKDCATKAIKAASDAETDVATHLSGTSLIALEGLVSSLGYFFSGNGSHALDFQLVLRKYSKREAGHTPGKWTQSFNLSFGLWCMNPAVSFTEIANLSMSVILTSGTLSPMSSFSSELGVKFETSMEAPHVIDVESQLWAAIIPAGPSNSPLNASYKTADGFDFQDELGASLEEICKIVPGGALVFFPSYNLMEKLCARWRETGQFCRLNAQKSLFIEPRGHQEDFELTLKGYYDSISQGTKPSAWKTKRGKRRGLKHVEVTEEQPSGKGGSAFLAVCRGKVSEGIDFSDDNARVVVIVGIPFPNIHDLKVGQKKNFNDTYKSSKNLLSGSEWYCQQAFRALNQAAGRCIRHRFDYGAIIFMDERFKEERNIAYVSKWVRKSIKKYNSFDTSLDDLRSFFQHAKERSCQQSMNAPTDFTIEDANVLSTEPTISSKGPGKRKNLASNMTDHHSEVEVVSKNVLKTEKASRRLIASNSRTNDNSNLHNFYSKVDLVDLTFAQIDEEDIGKCTDYINLERSPEDLRQSVTISMPPSYDSPEEVVQETPGMDDSITMINSAVLSNNGTSNSTIVQADNDSSDQLPIHSPLLEGSSKTLCDSSNSMMVTPERMKADMDDVKPEKDSSFSLSVNSHMQKRKNTMNFSLVNHSRVDSSSSLDVKLPIVECTRIAAFGGANSKIEFSPEVDPNEFQDAKYSGSSKLPRNCCSTSSLSLDLVMDKRLYLCCSLCSKPLGLPDNQFLVECSLKSSEKIYVASFLKRSLGDVIMNRSDSLLVVISDTASVDQKLYNRPTGEESTAHDMWSEKDGCVFRTVFCPFCTVSERFLGLQIVAADVTNVHLLNKIFFYYDCLIIKDIKAYKEEAFSPSEKPVLEQANKRSNGDDVSTVSNHGQVTGLVPFESFAYSPNQQSAGGWRTTKSKLRLRKRFAT